MRFAPVSELFHEVQIELLGAEKAIEVLPEVEGLIKKLTSLGWRLSIEDLLFQHIERSQAERLAIQICSPIVLPMELLDRLFPSKPIAVSAAVSAVAGSGPAVPPKSRYLRYITKA